MGQSSYPKVDIKALFPLTNTATYIFLPLTKDNKENGNHNELMTGYPTSLPAIIIYYKT